MECGGGGGRGRDNWRTGERKSSGFYSWVFQGYPVAEMMLGE